MAFFHQVIRHSRKQASGRIQRRLNEVKDNKKIGKNHVQWIWVENAKIKHMRNDDNQENVGKKATNEDDVNLLVIQLWEKIHCSPFDKCPFFFLR
jgi:hypothetical protein